MKKIVEKDDRTFPWIFDWMQHCNLGIKNDRKCIVILSKENNACDDRNDSFDCLMAVTNAISARISSYFQFLIKYILYCVSSDVSLQPRNCCIALTSMRSYLFSLFLSFSLAPCVLLNTTHFYKEELSRHICMQQDATKHTTFQSLLRKWVSASDKTPNVLSAWILVCV